MSNRDQGLLLVEMDAELRISDESSTTFINNLSLPVHRWFRYSAGFSAEWVEQVIHDRHGDDPVVVFDPFAGSATTLLAAGRQRVESWGIESHSFVCRIARAKLAWRSDAEAYRRKVVEVRGLLQKLDPCSTGYPPLIYKCYDNATLAQLDILRQACELVQDGTPASDLIWLTVVAILRKTSRAGTAQWQYILPRKQKRSPQNVSTAFEECTRMIYHDMKLWQAVSAPRATFVQGDARDCRGIPDGIANLVITSPPYPNNYDYADATRLEMSFMREIRGWGDLQATVRRHLVRSCTQHVPECSVDLQEIISSDEVLPIRQELAEICRQLAEIRKTKGGKKTYHLMIACYFRDLALVWRALRRVCAKGATACFVIGDSAPYGIYVPVIPWLGALAQAAGFHTYRFEKTRDRNVKWKNRKHRVPLQEGRLWVEG